MGSILEKNRDRKSRDTAPLKYCTVQMQSAFFDIILYSLKPRLQLIGNMECSNKEKKGWFTCLYINNNNSNNNNKHIDCGGMLTLGVWFFKNMKEIKYIYVLRIRFNCERQNINETYRIGWSDFTENNWALGRMCEIVFFSNSIQKNSHFNLWKFKNFLKKYCFLRSL